MTHIIIKRHDSSKTEVSIEGNAIELAEALATAIYNDQNFAMLIISALTIVAENQSKKFPDINLN